MKNILVKRLGALGDVILTTPIVRELARQHADVHIRVMTNYPEVYDRNPHVTSVVRPGEMHTTKGWFEIDLDLAYEKQPFMHIVDAYAMVAFGKPLESDQKQQRLYFDKKRLFAQTARKYVAVHAAHAGWRNRTLPRETWVKVIDGIRDAGFWPIMIGTPRDATESSSWCSQMLVPDIHVQARLISQCACFVGSDSGLLHVAGATDTPIVGVFTSVRPQARLPYRKGLLGFQCHAVVPPFLDCLGCQERQPAPSTTESCERGDLACVQQVRASDIVDAMIKLTHRDA